MIKENKGLSENWKKSSFSSSGGGCVEVKLDGVGGLLVRDSKNPAGARLHFTKSEWEAFVSGVKVGEFE